MPTPAPITYSDLPALGHQDLAETDNIMVQHLNGGAPGPTKFFVTNVGELASAVGAMQELPIAWQLKTSNFSAVARGQYAVNSSSGQVTTISLPASPAFGDTIIFLDSHGQFATHNVSVSRNGSKIEGLDEDLIMNADKAMVTMTYISPTLGWRISTIF